VRHCAVFVLVALAAVTASPARVDVTIDQPTLNDLVSKMTPENIPVTLAGGVKVHLLLEDVRVTKLEPAAGERGHVVTSLRLKVPELGLDVPVAPRLSVQFREGNGRKVAYLKFEEVRVPLPMTGPVDVSALLPLLPIVADNTWSVDSARGKMKVEPQLVDARLGTTSLRLGFDLSVTPLNQAAGATQP